MNTLMSKHGVTLSVASETPGVGVETYIVDDGHSITPWAWSFKTRVEAEAKFGECVQIVEASQCRQSKPPAETSTKPAPHRQQQQGMAASNVYVEGSDLSSHGRREKSASA